MINAWVTTVLLVLFAVTAGQAADNMKAFPTAEEGMVRYVLQLPRQADESAFKVELIVGKTVEVDE
jgi:ecotin